MKDGHSILTIAVTILLTGFTNRYCAPPKGSVIRHGPVSPTVLPIDTMHDSQSINGLRK